MANLKWWSLPILSGLMLGLSWPETGGLTLLIFLAFVPLLYFEHIVTSNLHKRHTLRIFAAGYITFFLFNFISTYWIKYASFEGMVMAEVLNSLFMALLLVIFSITKKRLGTLPGYLSFIIIWMAFEWVHYNWELSWVWLTLGNVFAAHHTWIQWYEYTGVLGGTLWVLITNVIATFLIIHWIGDGKFSRKVFLKLSWFVIALILPIFLSGIIYKGYKEENNPVEIVVVQPNIDPYKKYSDIAESEQIDRLVELASPLIDDSTDFMVCPETAWPGGYFEHELHLIYGTEKFRELIAEYPEIRIVTGLSTMKLYGPGEKRTETARNFNTKNYYDYYNTAMQLDSTHRIQLYHKSKLVLGVEKMPFGTLLKPLEKLSINLGGATGTLGHEDEAHNFVSNASNSNNKVVAPVICYESVYGEYMTEYIQKGAELIFIITNDGWWENTPGYRQHLAYAKLRAIESRRSIARSANTGISAFIDQRGDIFQATTWWEPTAIKGKLNGSKIITFYVKHGDYLGRVAAYFALMIIVLVIAKGLRKKNTIQT